FTPLVAALRALNRRVIGIGVKGSTSSLLPPACDEFLFYDRLPGVADLVVRGAKRPDGGNGPPRQTQRAGRDDGGKRDGARPAGAQDLHELQRMLTQTLAGLKQSGVEPVLASSLKRALLRKDPTFAEADYGFRAFGELLRQAERNGMIALSEGQARGDPAVDFPEAGQAARAFDVLLQTVRELQGDDDEVPLSGLKDQIRKRVPEWSEKDFGYSGFLQFVKAAAASGVVVMEWDDAEGDYFLFVPD
ncbi:MAG: OST-HTH/LOTUS domain-containing protein, partial [Acidimicrobiia bacterium]